MTEKIDHIGIAVADMKAAVETFQTILGCPAGEAVEVPEQKVRVVFFDVGGVHIELLEPTCPESTIAAFIEKRGPGLHHVAYRVKDIQAELDRLTAAGIRLLDEKPRCGAHGKKIAFVHPKSSGGVLTELCE
jgi:methylmalonyl-CoA/ethylmalonyl-CoA epimerase